MKLKCVGGLANGEIIEVDNYYNEHDIVRIAAKVEFKIIDFEEELAAFREGKVPESMVIPYYYYKVSMVHFKDYKLKFLIPEKWTIEQALYTLLGI